MNRSISNWLLAFLSLLLGIGAIAAFRHLSGSAADYVGALMIMGHAAIMWAIMEDRVLKAAFGAFFAFGLLVGLYTALGQLL